MTARKPTRIKGRAKARPFPVRKPKPPGWRRKGKGITISGDKAGEFFVGGVCSCMMLADRLGLKASVGGALMSALSIALPDLPLKGIVAAYHKIGDEIPHEAGAKLLAATAQKPKGKR